MASSQPLSLSNLRASTEYPLVARAAEGKCLIHVKLTEACARAIDGLITSEKGAVFSLWFTESGGHLSIPGGSSGSSRRFQFSTAVLQKVERQMGSLECLQQSTDPSHGQQLSCLGTMRHKLTIKATDDVYEKTKIRVTQVEEERKGHVAKVINITKGYSKNKMSSNSPHQLHRSGVKAGRTPISKTISTPSSVGSSGTVRPRDVPGGGASSVSKSIATAASGKTPRTLKDRVLYLLALKPLNRVGIVAKLKKATKRSESAMGNLDTILAEVSDLQNTTYHLKPHLLSELDVDAWPHYTEAERSLVKRRINNSRQFSSSSDHLTQGGQKRPPTSEFSSSKLSEASSTKKPKLSSFHLPSSTSSDHAPSYLHIPPISKKPSPPMSHESKSPPVISHMPTLLPVTSGTTIPSQSTAASRASAGATTQPKPPLLPTNNVHDSSTSSLETSASADKKSEAIGGQDGLTSMDTSLNSQPRKDVKSEKLDPVSKEKKRKKKHKAHRGSSPSPITNVCPSVSSAEQSQSQDRNKMATAVTFSTSEIPDFARQFPSISSDQQRAEYKKEFNHVYGEYLSLKQATEEDQLEVKTLTEQLETFSKESSNFKEIEKKIKMKYQEMRNDKTYQKNRKRFLELHHKLDHIKRMVVQYDNNPTSHLATS